MAERIISEKLVDGASAQHEELAPNSPPPSAADLAAYAEEAHYGASGLKGMCRSPYVFGAALLASMGGFSYGYGADMYRFDGDSPGRCLLIHPQTRASYR